MTPNEFYALPPVSVEPWYGDYSRAVGDVMDIDGLEYGGYEVDKDMDDGRFTIHLKLDHNIDGDRGVSIYALYFEGKPFALMFTGGRSGQDSRQSFVTDPEVWQQAKIYAMTIIANGYSYAGNITDPSVELTDRFYGSRITSFGGEVRLVAKADCHPMTGTPVFDRQKYREAFDAVIRPLGKKIGYENGLEDPRMLAAAISTYRTGIVNDCVPLNIDLGGDCRLIAANVVEEQTMAYTIRTRGRFFSWSGDIDPVMVGPASMIECFIAHGKGERPAHDCAYVVEAAEAFGAPTALVYAELLDYLENGGVSMAERIVDGMPRDERVSEKLTDGYPTFALGHMVRDNPGIRRFCVNGKPTEDDAERIVQTAAQIVAKLDSGEYRAPAP